MKQRKNRFFFIHLPPDKTSYINHLTMNDKLNILWTTDNKDTIFNMLAMYTLNSQNERLVAGSECDSLGSFRKVSRPGHTGSNGNSGNCFKRVSPCRSLPDLLRKVRSETCNRETGSYRQIYGSSANRISQKRRKGIDSLICKIYLQNKLYFSH